MDFSLKKVDKETMSAIFIVVLVSLFIFSNFIAGFVLPAYLVFVGLGFLIAFFFPRSGIYAIIFLTIVFERFFTLQSFFIEGMEYKIYLLDVIFVAVLLGIAWKIVSGNHKLYFEKEDYILISFIFLLGLYFFLRSDDKTLAFSSFKNYAFYSLFYFATATAMNRKKYISRLVKFFFAGAVAVVFFILFGIITGEGLWSQYTPLSTGGVRILAFTHAFYLTIAVLGTVSYLAFQKMKDVRVYWLVGIWIVGIIGSLMRHLWIGLAVSAVFIYFLLKKEQKEAMRKAMLNWGSAFIILIVIVFYIFSLFPHSKLGSSIDYTSGVVYSRISSLSSASSDESFSWRELVWKESISQYLKDPVLGIGLGKKIYVEKGREYRNFVEVRDIHNSLLALLVQGGIGIFLLFVYFVAIHLRELYNKGRNNWLNIALFAILANYLIVFFFQPYLETNLLGIFFWIGLGLVRVNSYDFFE